MTPKTLCKFIVLNVKNIIDINYKKQKLSVGGNSKVIMCKSLSDSFIQFTQMAESFRN